MKGISPANTHTVKPKGLDSSNIELQTLFTDFDDPKTFWVSTYTMKENVKKIGVSNSNAEIVDFAREKGVSLVMIGPEQVGAELFYLVHLLLNSLIQYIIFNSLL